MTTTLSTPLTCRPRFSSVVSDFSSHLSPRLFLVVAVSMATVGCSQQNAKPDEQPVPTDDGLTPERFAEQVPEAICDAYLACENQEVQQAALIHGMFSLGTASKHAAQIIDTELQPALAALDDGWVDERDECLPIARAVAKGYGIAPHLLSPKTGIGLVDYDRQAAHACLDSLRQPPDVCRETLRVQDPSVLSEGAARYATEEFFQPMFAACDDVLSGTLQPGELCEYQYECAGKSSRCNVIDSACHAL